jgi:hypothetical protein
VQNEDEVVCGGRQQSHRKTEEQEGPCHRNTTVATVFIDRSPGGSATRKELNFRKKFPIPISSLSQVLHLFSFIYLCLSFFLIEFDFHFILPFHHFYTVRVG